MISIFTATPLRSQWHGRITAEAGDEWRRPRVNAGLINAIKLYVITLQTVSA